MIPTKESGHKFWTILHPVLEHHQYLIVCSLKSIYNFLSYFTNKEINAGTRVWCLIPSTQLVEKKAMFLVSRGLSWVQSGDLLWGSDSPVSEELST